MRANKILSARAYLYAFKDKKEDPLVKELSAKYLSEAMEELMQMVGHKITLRYENENGKWDEGVYYLKSVSEDGTLTLSVLYHGKPTDTQFKLMYVIDMWTID